jgi:hypothetical protein
MQDYRVEYVLHAMPAETQLLGVVSAPNIVFDQPIFQMPDPETYLQLFACSVFWDIKNDIHQNEVLLSVYCTLTPERQGAAESKYPTEHFVFLTSNESRDKQIQQELHKDAFTDFIDESKTVYEFSDCKFICVPKPGLLIFTNDKVLMHTILSRLDSWWLKRVAMPTSLIEWKYVNQKAPYWGVRHFPSDDSTSPAHNLDGCVLDSQTIGLTFDYTDNSHALQITYISNNPDQRSVASRLIKDVDSWTAQHIMVQPVENRATQITVSDSRCLSPAVSAALEWFDPPFAMRVEQSRHRTHRVRL